MRKLLLGISIFFICSLANAQASKMFVQTNIDISYKDKEGNDLLGSTFLQDSIVVYNMVGKEKVKVDKPGKDYPNNHFIFKDEKQTNVLRVFLETETTYLQLNTKTTDVIKCCFKKGKGSLQLKKVWYNHKLVWKLGKNTSSIIHITK